MGIGWLAVTTGNRATQALLGLTLVMDIQWSARLSFDFGDRDRDWYSLSLNFETESETEILWVSISRPSRRLIFSSLSFETESETNIFLVSISRPSPRLKLSESQPRDRVRDHRIGWDQESCYTLVLDNIDTPRPNRKCKSMNENLCWVYSTK